MGFEVRLSDFETGLSSSAGTAGAETETAASVPLSSLPSVSAPPRSFHALKEKCSLKEDTLVDSWIGSNFLRKPGFVFLKKAGSLVLLPMVRFVSTRLRSCVALDFLSTHL